MLTAADFEKVRHVCERFGVVRLDVFGSLARGTASPTSDADLLYTLGPDVQLGWAIEDLALELSEILGRPVDLVSARGLNARLREQVLQEAQPFYAAA
ncbi:MAG: nucleotidyltransferase domain-containing protein [Propionibacteriaceae bacterium]|nr:nucleotidyltransferase domain-containing protein [Micropruina sp.]HBX81362.1 nucleotidyltransferase [Propionibacteriaceae bacterium]